MDSDQFDALVSRLTAQLTRRRSLGLAGALGMAGAGLATETDARKKKKKKHKKKPTTTKAPATQPPTTAPVPPPSTVVISQVYTRGGNPGAVYNRDYIVLFNRSTRAIDVGNWSVQVSGPDSPTWTVVKLTGVIMQPNQYLLIAGASGGQTGATLTTVDISSSASVLSGGGRIALVASPEALTCGAAASCVTANGVIDFLGYGVNGAHSEGGLPAAAPEATQALFRKGDGCVDTNNNGPDFILADPSPRTSSHFHECP